MSLSIYVISSAPIRRDPRRHEACPVKIGVSTDPRSRLASLQTGSHLQLSLEFEAETDDAFSIERRAFIILDERRLAGEWFDVKSREAISTIVQAARELGLELREPTERKEGIASNPDLSSIKEELKQMNDKRVEIGLELSCIEDAQFRLCLQLEEIDQRMSEIVEELESWEANPPWFKAV